MTIIRQEQMPLDCGVSEGASTALLQGAGGSSSLTAPLQFTRCENRIADAVVRRWHYLHRARVGRRLSYAAWVRGELEGVIVYAYPFTRVLYGVPADEVLEFSRLFLFHNVRNMASQFIAWTLRRVRIDWRSVFPQAKPVRFVVSWSDTERHYGTIYRAANFRFAGSTSPRLNGNRYTAQFGGRRPHQPDKLVRKDCWIYEFEGRATCARMNSTIKPER